MDDKKNVVKIIDVKLVKCVLKMVECFNKKNIKYKFNEILCDTRNMLSFNVKINDKWNAISTTSEFIEDCDDDLGLFEKIISDQIDFCLNQIDKDKNKMTTNKNLVTGVIRFVRYLHNNNIEYTYYDVFCEKTGVLIFKLKRLCGGWRELKMTSEFIEEISNLETFDDYIEHYVENTLK